MRKAERKGTQYTFLHTVKVRADKGLRERATFYYPIWWGTTPPVVNTFLNAHNFNGKTVIPFCTSGGSGISGSLVNINQYCAGATILRGIDATGDSADSIRSWLNSIGIVQ